MSVAETIRTRLLISPSNAMAVPVPPIAVFPMVIALRSPLHRGEGDGEAEKLCVAVSSMCAMALCPHQKPLVKAKFRNRPNSGGILASCG